MKQFTCKYGSIYFREGLKMSLSEFVEIYKDKSPFKYAPLEEREGLVNKAYKIVCDGNTETSSNKRKKSKSKKPTEDIIQGGEEVRERDTETKQEPNI